jgi:hypothetical protein
MAICGLASMSSKLLLIRPPLRQDFTAPEQVEHRLAGEGTSLPRRHHARD